MRIAVIGAGNGGQALAGHFAMLGHKIVLYTRSTNKLKTITQNGGIKLIEAINGFGKLQKITNNLEEAIKGSELIMVTTTADVHSLIATQISPFLQSGQIVVLNPGRTFGALDFSNQLKLSNNKRIMIAEAQSLIYACRSEKDGKVRIIGVKRNVLLAGYPSKHTTTVVSVLNSIFPCFIPAENILHTSLENIGAIFHPAVVLLNAAAIERGNDFFFYNDITPAIANFLLRIDEERLNIGKALGLDLMGIEKWVSYAYPDIQGSCLFEKMRNNPAYFKILAPKSIISRLITEDVPTGLVPLSQLGDLIGVRTVLMNSIINICSSLTGIDFWKTGRNIDSLGITKKTKNQFFKQL
jgi:opine dehydrogenase